MAAVTIDASALIELLIGPAPDQALRRHILTRQLNGPESLQSEVPDVLRRRVRARLITLEQADRGTGPSAFAGHRQLVPRAWELRHSVSAYDAMYVAPAENDLSSPATKGWPVPTDTMPS